MAISKAHSLLFLLFLLFSLKTQARAVRESHFFNKATRDDTIPIEPQTLVDKQQLPNPKQEDPSTTTTSYQQSQNGYGLYKNSYYNNNNNEYSLSSTTTNEEYENARDLPAKYSTEEYTQGKTYETQFVEKPQGMSDTRFLENGRYYFDVNAEKNQYQNRYGSTQNNYMGYRSTRANNNNNYMGYYEPSKRVNSVNNRYNNNYGGSSYYGNNENTFETEEDFEP